MSKINDLIKELCPNGVEFYQIKDIAKVTIGEFVHKNKQSDDNINNILNLIKNRESTENKSYLATYEEIKENEYNISVNSYLKNTDIELNIDIEEVNRKLAEIVPRQQQIRKELEEIIKELEEDYHE